MSDAHKNAYTDAPWLQESLFLSSIRLLFWLFFHPSAWRNHLNHVDASLRPNFCLAELKRWQWQNPALLRLLISTHLVWPFMMALLIAFTLRVVNMPVTSIIIGMVLGLAAGFVAAMMASLAGSVAIGVPVGIGVGLVVGGIGSQIDWCQNWIFCGPLCLGKPNHRTDHDWAGWGFGWRIGVWSCGGC